MTIPMLYATFGPDKHGKMKANSILDFTLGVFGTGVIWYFVHFVWFCQSNFLLLMQPDTIVHHQKRNIKESMQNLCAILLPSFNIFSSLYTFFEVSAVDSYKTEGIWSPSNVRAVGFVLLLILFNLQHNFFQVIVLRFRERTKIFCELITSGSKPTQNVLKEYEQLDLHINQLNEKFGTWILISAVFAIPYLSQKFIELFKGSVSLLAGLLNIPFLIAEIFYLLMAAEGSFQVRTILIDYYEIMFLVY